MVTGAAGMLGQDVVEAARRRGHDVRPLSRQELDVTDAAAVLAAAAGSDVIVNCAAWTAVDDAEAHEADAFTVNAVAAAHLARAAAQVGARMVQISTDYVFDGSASTPYLPDAALAPRSAYGRTKAAGEWASVASCSDTLLVRTAWLYGAGGPCFPKTIARAAATRDSLDVVDDQVGQPTWTADVAALVLDLLAAEAPAGGYHATSSGEVSWYGFAREVVAAAGRDPAMVHRTDSRSFVRPAHRPAYSVLDHGSVRAAGVTPIADWRGRWQAAADRVLDR